MKLFESLATGKSGTLTLLLLALVSQPVLAADAPATATLLAGLRSGGYNVLMRHASSPRTLPDAASAHPGNDKLERQLDEAGLAAAREFGDALRRLKIPIGDLMSSPTYRALETIRIAKLGTARTADELGEAGMAMAPPGAPQGATPAGNNASTAWLKAQLGKLPRKGKNTFLITHFPNITSALGEAAKGLADGEAVVTRPDGGGGFVVVGRIKIEEWSNLDAR